LSKSIMRKFSAIVPAAGLSARMPELKALLPIGDTPMLLQTITALRAAGIERVLVVLGCQAEKLRPLLNQHEVDSVVNNDYTAGMFSSIKVGVACLPTTDTGFFVLPADMPFVHPETIIMLGLDFAAQPCSTLYPVYAGRRGHPPLISSACKTSLLAYTGPEGLRGFLRICSGSSREAQVQDPGIHLDIDTPADYAYGLQFAHETGAAYNPALEQEQYGEGALKR